MTLAVILGICSALTPWSATGTTIVALQEMPAQETAPAEAAPKPAEQTPSAAPSDQAPSTAAPQKPEPTTTAPAAKPKKKTHKKKPAPQAGEAPPKVVVHDGSTNEPTVKLGPAETQKQTSNQIQSVSQLLANTDANLKLISAKTLDATQQETVKQIKSYMDKARKAVDSGDVDQGRTLAFKAHLLSDDLVKH